MLVPHAVLPKWMEECLGGSGETTKLDGGAVPVRSISYTAGTSLSKSFV